MNLQCICISVACQYGAKHRCPANIRSARSPFVSFTGVTSTNLHWLLQSMGSDCVSYIRTHTHTYTLINSQIFRFGNSCRSVWTHSPATPYISLHWVIVFKYYFSQYTLLTLLNSIQCHCCCCYFSSYCFNNHNSCVHNWIREAARRAPQ